MTSWIRTGIGVAGVVVLMLAAATPRSSAEPQSRTSAAKNKFGHATSLPKQRGAVRLATYNVLNLFDHHDDPTLQGDHDDIDMATTVERCRKLAEAIIATDADIIALQEVESLQCLKWFRDEFLPRAGYKYLASKDVGYYRGVECSVMSRFPILEARTWPNVRIDNVRREGHGWTEVPQNARGPMGFQRSPLMVTVKVRDDYELTVFSLHHKASSSYRWQREAEAIRIVEILNKIRERDPSRNVVVMGDFNAAPWDKSVRLYLEAGMIDTMAHRIIPRWKNPDLTEANLYKTHESARVIDFILMNSAAHRELVVGSARVMGTLMPPDTYDWRTDPHPPGYASDHYPVMIDIVPKDVK